jgi:uncharacterized protein (TIGR03086 family)
MSDADRATTTEASPVPADDPRSIFERAASLAGEVIDAVPSSRLAAPTPAGMDVRDLLEHLVMVLRRVACAGRGEDPWQWPVGAPDVGDEDFADAWRGAAREAKEAWADDATLDRPTALPWGTFGGTEVLGVYTNEITVHTWDLARGTGQSPRWDEDVLAVADTAIHAQLPTSDRSAMWAAAAAALPPDYEWEDPFGPAVEVDGDAPLIDRLVAWNGRQP